MASSITCVLCERKEMPLNPFVHIEDKEEDFIHDGCLRNAMAVHNRMTRVGKISRDRLDFMTTLMQIHDSLGKCRVAGVSLDQFIDEDPIKKAAIGEKIQDLKDLLSMDPVEERCVEAIKSATINEKINSVRCIFMNSRTLTIKGKGEIFKHAMSMGNREVCLMIYKDVEFEDQVWGLRNAANQRHTELQKTISVRMGCPEYSKMSPAALTDEALLKSAKLTVTPEEL